MKATALLFTLTLILTSLGSSASIGVAHANPLNIMATPQNWKGEIECTDGRAEPDGQLTECFENYKYGIRAAIIILYNYQSKYGINTLSALTERWATHNTEQYAIFLADRLGIETDTKFKLQGNPIFLANLIEAMVEFENGFSPYPFDELYEVAIFTDWTED